MNYHHSHTYYKMYRAACRRGPGGCPMQINTYDPGREHQTYLGVPGVHIEVCMGLYKNAQASITHHMLVVL